MQGSVLVVDDDDDAAQLMSEGLRKRGIAARSLSSAAAALEYLRDNRCDVVVTDVHMAGMTGIELCEQLKIANTDVLAIVVTGNSELPTAVAAIRAGAFDFVTKPLKVDALSIAVSRALEHLGLKRELQRLREHAAEPGPSGIAGTSPAIRKTIDLIERVAGSDVTVLITGESGTGKELVARALHDQSPRAAQPFVAINCAAMPAPLLESELFGHVRGAFTDAKEARQGLFVQAKGGTVFLDEIGEMPPEMQVKLLRVLQERTVRPVGGDTELAIKARVITATNRNLEHEVEDKRFREDLYYRINVVPIPVPPLRERQDDILMLAQLFLTRIAKRMNKRVRGISQAAGRRLLDYDWPGNVRELENCMERAVAICRLDEITIEDLPATLVDEAPESAVLSALTPDELITIDEMTQRYVRKVLAMSNGNKTHAAKVLGIDRRSLYRRLTGGDAEK
ncbi:MAG TPA: sigma-54 dependent transcriptional regulator [Kofleriaceae bacterium]|nr:sigma-54 dependent transcriptional regulator [Kofleriaceae bacterium]